MIRGNSGKSVVIEVRLIVGLLSVELERNKMFWGHI